MEVSNAIPAPYKPKIEKFEAQRPTRAQSLPVPLARELTPGLTRENLDQHNKVVGGSECPVRENDLQPWIPFPRSVTHVEDKGSIGGVLMERQPARRGDLGGHPGKTPGASIISQTQTAEPGIKISASDPGASCQRLKGRVDLERDGDFLDQGGRKPG